MIFAAPWAFLLILPLAAIVIACSLPGGKNAFLFSSIWPARLAGKSLRQRLLWAVPALGIAAACLFILALARPQEGVRRVNRTREGVAIQMLMDISSSMGISMRATAGKSTRLEIAKRAFADFVAGDGEALPGRSDDLIGLITFARYPNTVCPLTLSHDILLYFARELQIEERPNEDGTAYGDALALAAARLARVESTMDSQFSRASSDYLIRSKVAILLTDGENNCGRHLPLEAAAMAKKWGVRVYTIGFGERKRTEKVETEAGAQVVAAPLDAIEENLREVAEMTGGFFRRAHDAESLRTVYEEIDNLEKSRLIDLGYTDYEERFAPFALAGICCLALAALLNATWLRKT